MLGNKKALFSTLPPPLQKLHSKKRSAPVFNASQLPKPEGEGKRDGDREERREEEKEEEKEGEKEEKDHTPESSHLLNLRTRVARQVGHTASLGASSLFPEMVNIL